MRYAHVKFYANAGTARSVIHLQQDSTQTMCGLSLRSTETFEGRELPLVFEIREPATCKKCRGRLATQVRDQIRKLTISDLETIAALL